MWEGVGRVIEGSLDGLRGLGVVFDSKGRKASSERPSSTHPSASPSALRASSAGRDPLGCPAQILADLTEIDRIADATPNLATPKRRRFSLF